jgi:hypothetical protein
MQQQLFEFVQQATRTSPVRLEPRIVAQVTRQMAAAIVAVALQRKEESDEELRGERQADG